MSIPEEGEATDYEKRSVLFKDVWGVGRDLALMISPQDFFHIAQMVGFFAGNLLLVIDQISCVLIKEKHPEGFNHRHMVEIH